MDWSDISLGKFQLIQAINEHPDYDELDKLLHTTCIVFNKTEHQLSTTKVKKVNSLIAKISKLFSKPFPTEPSNWIGIYQINYDISKIRFGQYVELTHFLQGNTIDNAHLILASLANLPLMANSSIRHSKVSDYLLRQPISKIGGSIAMVIEQFGKFNKQYAGLFDMPQDEEQQFEEEMGQVQPFNKQYGWIYSATRISEHERITLDQAYDLPIIQALNDLAYLKSKQEYDNEQMKKNVNSQ